MGDDDKPFACSEPDCGMRFAIEDHLSVHKMKHQMSLTLTPGAKSGSLLTFVDQTPTPTKFLRNMEEIGLFNELVNNNPFEEAFKKAAKNPEPMPLGGSSVSVTDTGQDSLNTPTPLALQNLATVSVGASDTLNTPNPPHLLRHESPPKSRLARETFAPLPGPNSETCSTVGSTPGEGSSQSPSSQESFSLKSPDGANKPGGIAAIKMSPMGLRTLNLDTKGKRLRSNSSQSQGKVDEDIVAIPKKRERNFKMKAEVSSSDEMTVDQEEDEVAPSPGSVSSQLGSPAGVATSPGVLRGALASAGSPVVPVTSLAKSDSQYLLQVMVQMPNGHMMPVHIPAAIANTAATTITTATPTVSKQTAVQPKNFPVTIAAASSPAVSSTSASIKQKLKETIRQNAQNNIMNDNMHVISEAAEMASSDSISYISMTPSPEGEPLTLSTAQTEVTDELQLSPPVELRVQRQAADTSTPSSSQGHFYTKNKEQVDADERRNKFLERNRAAAARCRKKKKIWTCNLEKKADELQNANGVLQVEVSSLRAEVAQLKSLLLAHRDCPVTKQQQRAVPELIQTVNNNSLIIATETTPSIVTMATTTPTNNLTTAKPGPVIVSVRSLKPHLKPNVRR